LESVEKKLGNAVKRLEEAKEYKQISSAPIPSPPGALIDAAGFVSATC